MLFISPMGEKQAGGISKWTHNIIDYYNHQKDDTIELIHCYNKSSVGAFGGDSFFTRIRKGIQYYVPVIEQVKTAIKTQKIDVVHLCSSASFSLLIDLIILKIEKKHGIKSVIHFHFGRMKQILEDGGWEYKLMKKVLYMADLVVLMDKASYTALQERGYKNISLLPNPLSTDTQNLAEKYSNEERKPSEVLFAGHIVVSKGVHELVKACSEIGNIRLVLMGYIPQKDIVDELRCEAGPDNEWLDIRGVCPFEDVIKEMCKCGVFVLPSYSEGFPNVIIESMACSCPIIATNVGAIPELLSDDCGVVVEPKSVEALKNAIVKMIGNKNLSIQYGERAKNKIYSKYLISDNWEQLSNIWRNA